MVYASAMNKYSTNAVEIISNLRGIACNSVKAFSAIVIRILRAVGLCIITKKYIDLRIRA